MRRVKKRVARKTAQSAQRYRGTETNQFVCLCASVSLCPRRNPNDERVLRCGFPETPRSSNLRRAYEVTLDTGRIAQFGDGGFFYLADALLAQPKPVTDFIERGGH